MVDNSHVTQQEGFWQGDFGTEYIQRNQSQDLFRSNVFFFAKALRLGLKLTSCIEFGANVGMNLRALKVLYPDIDASAIELNEAAVERLQEVIPAEKIYNGSIIDYPVERIFDLVLIKGVLIHIAPADLNKVYEKLVGCTSKYLLVAEYYNPVPVSVTYRGNDDVLFKRDFAGEILEQFPCMRLVDYGFIYRNDPSFPLDDITWFLLEKTSNLGAK